MKNAFINYSKGLAEIPPVGELIIDDAPGDVHIKYGYIRGGKHYVIKIASGFSGNLELGIKPGQGIMLLFDLKTGQPVTILIDNANLTDIRTGIAGAIVSKELASEGLDNALIIGTGVQARYQAKYICENMKIKNLHLWGRDGKKVTKLIEDLSYIKANLVIEKDLESAVNSSRLVITTTSSKKPLIKSEWVQKGTHITAVGSDTHEKCELDSKILAKADLVVADSLEQNLLRGEVHQAIKKERITENQIIEIGEIFNGSQAGRITSSQISVADLTGVAVQDLVIAESVYRAHLDN
tara:strand:- start:579 stop:1466 length:888 start_codon:yes stop_codon:yes gene_type:complete